MNLPGDASDSNPNSVYAILLVESSSVLGADTDNLLALNRLMERFAKTHARTHALFSILGGLKRDGAESWTQAESSLYSLNSTLTLCKALAQVFAFLFVINEGAG